MLLLPLSVVEQGCILIKKVLLLFNLLGLKVYRLNRCRPLYIYSTYRSHICRTSIHIFWVFVNHTGRSQSCHSDNDQHLRYDHSSNRYDALHYVFSFHGDASLL